MKGILTGLLIIFSIAVYSQPNSVNGTILNRQGEPLPYATAVLMDPADSTLIYYGISGENGVFEIRNVNQGTYLLQVAFMGYKTMYRKLSVPLSQTKPFIFAMEEKSTNLEAAEIVGEAVPLSIKEDTIEYNRAAYKLKEGAVVEDLLRKLPGVEVDRAGNIKAMGEDVRKVYVDGKEFFGNDPKVATKNLPAEAVKKVQMYDKKSDESEFTGIDDGSKEKTMNLVLEKDMKDMLFGSVAAGGGMPSVYEASARTFYHNEKFNFAGLGMLNNINNPGFSFGDYMNFGGGGISLGGEGGISIGGGNSLPVNFGQPVYGKNTSGAAGLNLAYATDKNNRVYLSYMANLTHSDIIEDVYSRSYTSNSSYEQNSISNEFRGDSSHVLNFGLRRRLDSTTNITFNASLNLNRGAAAELKESNSQSEDVPVNSLSASSSNGSHRAGASANTSFIKMLIPGKTILKFNANINYSRSADLSDFSNSTLFFTPFNDITETQYQDENSENLSYSGKINLTQKLASKYFIEANLRYQKTREQLIREQGANRTLGLVNDSLSPQAETNFSTLVPGLGIRRSGDKSQFQLMLEYQISDLNTTLNGSFLQGKEYINFLPRANYEIDFGPGKRLDFNYSSSVKQPVLNQLIPLVNNLNPLFLVRGNPDLEPENSHQLNGNILIFDQFSMTSVFASLRGEYILNKINWARSIDENLVQYLMPVNVDYGINFNAAVDFSRPIRKLGMKLHMNLQEDINKGISPVNRINNEYTSFTHDFSLSLSNRKKQKIDASAGVGLRYTDTQFSIQEHLNDVYFDVSWFGEIDYTPNNKIDLSFSADVINYNQESFSESIVVPLLNTELNYHFPASKRATLSLRVYDMLNRDTGVQRLSELNYLREIRRNTLGRYIMISLKFKLNKFAKNSNSIEIKMDGRRH